MSDRFRLFDDANCMRLLEVNRRARIWERWYFVSAEGFPYILLWCTCLGLFSMIIMSHLLPLCITVFSCFFTVFLWFQLLNVPNDYKLSKRMDVFYVKCWIVAWDPVVAYFAEKPYWLSAVYRKQWYVKFRFYWCACSLLVISFFFSLGISDLFFSSWRTAAFGWSVQSLLICLWRGTETCFSQRQVLNVSHVVLIHIFHWVYCCRGGFIKELKYFLAFTIKYFLSLTSYVLFSLRVRKQFVHETQDVAQCCEYVTACQSESWPFSSSLKSICGILFSLFASVRCFSVFYWTKRIGCTH
jgi:hypothetical protein